MTDGRKVSEIKTRGQQVYLNGLDIPVFLSWVWLKRDGKSGATPRAVNAQGNAHQDSGNFTDGVGRQYIGEVGKTDNGNVLVTTHIYDGVRSLPLDVEIYYKADNFPQGKEDELFQKKPEIALALIEKCLNRNLIPEVVLIDASYGNNSSLLNKMEEKKLTYIGAIAKNRKVKLIKENKKLEEKRIDEIAQDLNKDEYEIVELKEKKCG